MLGEWAVFEKRMPRSCKDSSFSGWQLLRRKVIQVFEKANCSIDSSDIEACHCIAKKKTELPWRFVGEAIANECY